MTVTRLYNYTQSQALRCNLNGRVGRSSAVAHRIYRISCVHGNFPPSWSLDAYFGVSDPMTPGRSMKQQIHRSKPEFLKELQGLTVTKAVIYRDVDRKA